MTTPYKIRLSIAVSVLVALAISLPQQSVAQRFNHSGGGGNVGGGRPASMPTNRPAQGFSRPAPVQTTARPAQTFNRPAPVQTPSRPAQTFNRPAPIQNTNNSINGGARNFGNHNIPRNNVPAVQPQVNRTSSPSVHNNVHINVNDRPQANNAHHENVNVYHSRNVPYHAYSYHPYQPYHWGPRWHPIGFVAGVLAADAFNFMIGNQPYYYDEGVYYEPTAGGYAAVPAPVGAVVANLPDGYQTVEVGDAEFYYYAGVFYISTDQGFEVVTAPYGAVVDELPDGAVEQDINGQSYLVYNNTYYQPVSDEGEDAYEVVQAY